jgi:hypothetical protein
MAPKATETVETPAVVTENAPGTDLVVSDFSKNVRAEISSFATGDTGIMSTFTGDDFFQVAKSQLAATSGSEPIADHLKETILLDNWVIQPVEIADENGELQQTARVTLVDTTNGKSYHATGMTLVNSLKSIVAALGNRLPSEWPEPLPVKVVESRTRKGFKFFDLQVVL